MADSTVLAKENSLKQIEVVKELLRLLEMHRARRKRHEERWREVAEYILPDREILLRGVDQKGMTTHANVYDDIGTHCLHVWADGILGNTASPGSRWQRYKMRAKELNEVSEVKQYLQDYEEQMYDEFQGGGLYKALGIFLRDLGSVGTASCYPGDQPGKQYPYYKVFHPVEIFIGENEQGEIDIELREYYITLRNLVNWFGEEAVGEKRAKQARLRPLDEVRCLWALVPREERIEGLLHYLHKPIASFYVDIEMSRMLREEGYDEMPVITARCIQDGGEEYGRSPGSNAIRDVKMASGMAMANILGAQRLVDPAMDAPIERRGQISKNPGAWNFYEKQFPAGSIYPIHQGGIQLPAGFQVLETLEEHVKRHYFYDIFLRILMERKQQTATEIEEAIGERAVVLAPLVNQYLSEGPERIIGRTASISGRAGRLPAPPQVIMDWIADNPRRAKYGMKVQFIGPLAVAQQRAFKRQGIRGFMEDVAAVPSQDAVLDRPNWDEIVEDLANAHGVPEKDVRTDEEVAKIREQRAKLQQAMQQAELAKAGAEAGAKMSTRPQKGSPMEAMMSGAA
jgi:hypothetical protein